MFYDPEYGFGKCFILTWKRHKFCCCWVECSINVIMLVDRIWKTWTAHWFFCLLFYQYLIGVWKSSIIFLDLSVSSFSSVGFCSLHFKTLLLVHKCLRLLGRLDKCVSIFFFEDLILLCFFKFIYFWLHWVFVAARGLSSVAVSGGYSSLRCAGFSSWWLLLLWSTGSRHVGFSSCDMRAE